MSSSSVFCHVILSLNRSCLNRASLEQKRFKEVDTFFAVSLEWKRLGTDAPDVLNLSNPFRDPFVLSLVRTLECNGFQLNIRDNFVIF